MMKTMRIAAIPGDGIGKEVLPEGIRVLQAAAERWGFALSFEQMECGQAASITAITVK
ncbi:isocitrate/isopropylmalate family dehydrogenase [Escherichia coli]